MWQLKTQDDKKRIYINSATGSTCSQTQCYTDKDGNKWYSFDDILSMPEMRRFVSQKISSLYSLGLSKDDIAAHVDGMKSILKSNDKEKYEKLYANILDFESKANNATDAVKQLSALSCVYFTINDEPIDSFGNDLQIKKMALMEADLEMHSFFLRMQIDLIERYHQRLNLLSQIVLPTETELSDHLKLKSEELRSQNVI